MSPEQEAYRDAFLAELWPVCREVPREERAVERTLSHAQITLSDRTMWKDGASKTAPGSVVRATDVFPGPTPDASGGTAMLTHPHPARIEASR